MCWERDRPGRLKSHVFFGRHAIGEIFLGHLVRLDAYFFSSINSELRVKKFCNLSGSDRELLQNPFWRIFFCEIMGNKLFSLFFSLPTRIAMRSHLLNDIVRDWEQIQLPSEDTSAGLILSQEMPATAVNDALIPIKKPFFALHFENCLA